MRFWEALDVENQAISQRVYGEHSDSWHLYQLILLHALCRLDGLITKDQKSDVERALVTAFSS